METFNPVDYSDAELSFLKQNLGNSPGVAFANGVPQGVVVKQVRPLLQYVKDKIDLKHQFVGVEAIVRAIEVWETVQAQVRELRKRGAPRWPSMYSYDAKGRPHRGGPGSDSSKIITYFDEDGNRKPLAIHLEGDAEGKWIAPWAQKEVEIPKELINNPPPEGQPTGYLECAICHHTERYKADSAGSERSARARMSKHMKSTDNEPELHREYKLNVFGS